MVVLKDGDDMATTVPAFFKCPITLELMKYPVSLCTGVTYERASIQQWFDGGHNTCPATMRVLQNKNFVPNRTLQRLIHIWSESTQISTVASSVSYRNQIKSMIENRGAKGGGRLCFDDLLKIVNFVEQSEDNRDFTANIAGFVPMLVGLLDSDGAEKIETLELAVRILDLMWTKIANRHYLQTNLVNCLSSLLTVLRRGRNLEARAGSVRLLQFIALHHETNFCVVECDRLLRDLVKSVGVESDPRLIETILPCLNEIAMVPRVKSKLIDLQIISEVKKLLLAPSATVLAIENALKLLEALIIIQKGKMVISRDYVCVEAVATRLVKTSKTATKHAVALLWNLCFLHRDERLRELVMRCDGAMKVLLLLQCDFPPRIRKMLADLLKVLADERQHGAATTLALL